MRNRLCEDRRGTVIVFCRAPQIGAVKSRLARDVGRLRAWRFYSRCLAGTLAEARDARWRLLLAVMPDRDGGRFRLFSKAAARRPQGGGDLGRRMRRALLTAGGPAVLVGSDIPGLRRRHLAAALAALRRADAVFGPAEDGGYWLVGLRRPAAHRELFRGVRWSGPHALADSIASLGPGRRRAVLVERLGDVDTGPDLALAPSRPITAPPRPRQCSSRRGISSAKLQGRNRMSS